MCTSLGQTLRYTQVSCKHDLYLLNMNIDLKRIALLVGTPRCQNSWNLYRC